MKNKEYEKIIKHLSFLLNECFQMLYEEIDNNKESFYNFVDVEIIEDKYHKILKEKEEIK